MGLQNLEELVPGIGRAILRPAMNEDGPPAHGGDFELPDQPLALRRVRRALVVVVQPDLAAGDDLRLGQQTIEFGE